MAQERLESNCFALAQAPMQERIYRASFGAAVDESHVRIRFLGHASFAIDAMGDLLAVTDYTGFIGNPDVVPDVVTMNNAHSTHWTSNPDPRIPHVLNGWPENGSPAFHELDLGGMLVRNVTTDPFVGAARDEVVDGRVYAEILRQWTTMHPEFTYLPRKFKIAISGAASAA